MLAIVAAIIGGVLFFWLQQLFKKFEGGASPFVIMQFVFGLAVLAVMAFILPLLL